MLIPPFRTRWIAVAFGFSLAASNAWAYTTVGDPTNNPTQLQAAIMGVYNSGADGVTINAGQYKLPSGNITLSNLTRQFEIMAYGVTIIDPQNGIEFDNCANLSVLGLTIASTFPNGNQGQITAFGTDSNGVYCEIQCDAGYPTAGWGYCTVMQGNSNKQRVGCYDLGNFSSQDNLGNNKIRAHFKQQNWNGWTLQVGDYLTSHGGAPGSVITPPLEVNTCQNCLFQEITIQASPSWCAIREDNCTSNHYYNDTITYGPAPTGATAVPLRSTGSGFQGCNDYVGPNVQSCLFEGMSDDGFDLRGQLVNITAISGNTVTLQTGWTGLWNLHDPIRLSDGQGGYQDATVSGVSGDTLTLDQNVSVQVSNGFVSNPKRNCGGYQITGTTVRDNRARGAVVRGDNGLIQGCTFTNIAGQAVVIGVGPYQSDGEADYSHNVVVEDNTINNVGFAYNQGMLICGTGYGSGTGPLGNQNITIRNNTFLGAWGTNIVGANVSGLSISWNTFGSTYQSSLTNASGPVIDLEVANNVTLTSNLVTAAGPYETGFVTQGTRVTNVYNNNSAGIQKGMLSSGVYKMSPLSAPALSLNATGTNNGTPLEQVTSSGSADQQWVVTQRNGASTTVQHLGTNQIIDDPGASTKVGNLLATYTYNPSAPWQLLQFNDIGGGVSNIVNPYDNLVLDVPGAYTNSGQQIQQYNNDGTNACKWLLSLLAATPGYNLLTNGSFEWGLYDWTATGPFYYESPGYAQDGNNLATAYATSPYTATLAQTVTGLANGYYTATAWVESSGGMSSAYLYVSNYGSGQLNSPTIPTAAPGLGNWQKVTITDIPVTNGQCTIGFYAQDTTGARWIRADGVQFFRQ